MTLKSTIIPKKVRVFYATYANLPTTGLVEEDLGYATDRLVLYRWSGAAWVAITIHVSSGAAASIPTAANLPNGSIYHETDTNLVKMVQSGAWATISQLPSGWTVVEASADQTINNSTTSTNDTHLLFAVGANKTYAFDLHVVWHANGGSDCNLKCDFTFPAGAVCPRIGVYDKIGTPEVENKVTTGQFTDIDCNANVYGHIIIRGIVITAGAAGTLQLRWAQNAAVVQDSIRKRGSWLAWREV